MSLTRGAEYMIPMSSMGTMSDMVAALNVAAARIIAAQLVDRTNVHACRFETLPDGIGLFFPLALSRSASIRSFSMYMPVATNREIMGAGMILCNSNDVPDSAASMPRTPGIANSPATVASEYSTPHFQRDLNRIACDFRSEH
jgi:hypothetical protein